MDGFLLDAYADPERSEMVVWVKGEKGAVALREPFTPSFYVRAPAPELHDLAEALALVPEVGRPLLEERLCELEEQPSLVMRVPVRRLDALHPVAQMVDERGHHRDFDLYDVDLRLTQRYFIARNLFPLAWVRAWAPGRIRLRDEAWSLDYEQPPLTRCELRVTPDVAAGTLPTQEHPVASVQLDEETISEGTEATTLARLAERVRERDPDIVITYGGDQFWLPYLYARAKACGLRAFELGREPSPHAATRRGKSYFSYGKIKYQPPVVPLRGRIHLDADNSFFYREAGMAGLVDLCRISGVTLAEMARLGAGTAITAIQINRASAEGRLVPWKKNRPEQFKTGLTLLAADRGGYTFEPRVGLFSDVVELDFASLYPNIMVTRNLSPETVLCPCHAGRTGELPPRNVVPQVGYHVCPREGFIPRAMAPVIARREHFKKRRERDPGNRPRYQGICDMLKWLLVCSFGYQGYRNAKFGRIECHESICAWGREILLSASEVARDHGFEFVHGIIDSLWIERLRPDADPHALAEAVEKEIGIRFEYQGRYKWIVFLPTRGRAPDPDGPEIGALNRYYGCFDKPPKAPSRSQAGQEADYLASGALKVRGVELRQSNTPPIVVEAQERALTTLARANDGAEFLRLLPDALEAARPVLSRIVRGECAPEELLFTTTISKELESYRAMTDGRAALEQLARRGVRVAPGDRVRYVILQEGGKDPEKRVREARLLAGPVAYDRGAYAHHVLRGLESLFLPFGLTERALEEHYGLPRRGSEVAPRQALRPLRQTRLATP
ncbi:MAG TPA: DNA polymerase domain-containing protein [Candidatus Thermoplasmatota archaeon]|nr:DNA polymerase domain-containing protein [Candidatus Thermoplasmatota archaeon]